MQGIARHTGRWGLLSLALTPAIAVLLVAAGSAMAISAPIHIANTGGEGVFIRPDPNTSRPAVGWMPEGASPDYHCFAWGQNINGVPIWFNVTYNGKTGYYASYFDDSSYHSNEELTAKYGVPLCGSAPSPSPSPPPQPAPAPQPSPAPPSSPPSAPGSSADPAYPVMNAAGGIYWRSAPDWATPVARPGNGVYEGTKIAVKCYQAGTSVPGSNDTMWEEASVIAGPGSGSGWINEHFINDGSVINQPSPGVPACGGTPPATVAPPKAPPAPTEQVLIVDPSYWCVKVDLWRHFGTQIREADWKVRFAGLQGTPHQNDWKCSYSVVMTVPGPGGDSGPLPPVTEHFPINFREVCAEQFPGSRLQYELGPIYPAGSPWPWECIGAAGKYYPPPTLSIGALLRRGGLTAHGVPTSASGVFNLDLVAYGHRKSRASASRVRLLAKGGRSTRHAGRYSFGVKLTPSGRRTLRHARRIKIAFVLRFTSSSGQVRRRTTIMRLTRSSDHRRHARRGRDLHHQHRPEGSAAP